tara:strand:+ start:56 stop:349 length:294 start_codon:yes stop_codon:yes gene_type:complete
MMGIQYTYHKQQWFLTRGFEMNASRIDSLAADYADENGCVSADKVFEIFSECIEEDPATSHELKYGWTDKEDLWDDYCEDTEMELSNPHSFRVMSIA